MDTGRGPENARADWPGISETDLFCWVVLYIVTRVIYIYIIDERRGPENARADWPRISESDLFVLGALVTSDVSTAWIHEEVQRIQDADWP